MIFIPMYSFEFGPGKSESNQIKHGIDFVQAQAIWQDPILLKLWQSLKMSQGPWWSAGSVVNTGLPLLLTAQAGLGLSLSDGHVTLR